MLLVVYAVGLYVDPKATKRLLSSEQADISGRSGLADQAVFDGKLHCYLSISWLKADTLHLGKPDFRPDQVKRC